MSRKIKLIYIIDTLIVGGAQTLLVEIVKALDLNLFDVQVVTLVTKGSLAEKIEKIGVKVIHIQKQRKYDLGLIFKLRKFLKQESPDIVHTHLFGSDTWGRIAAYLAKVPVIISTEHNINPDLSFIKRQFKRFLALITDKIIAISFGARDFAVVQEKISLDKYKVIYNAIKIEDFLFRGYREINQNNIKAAVIARLDEQKGHTYLIQAMPQILLALPNFHLAIIGHGKLADKLKQEVTELKLQDTIKFLGVKENIQSVLQDLDLFIMPSVWEGLGIAVIESQAIGVPVLITNVPGMSELVTDQETGVLCAPQNPADLAAKVISLVENKALQQKIVPQARQQVETKFRLEDMISAYVNLYQELLTQKNINLN